ncbi:hypothetical protein RN001_015999 [Aquatica leii]|uniref:Histone deacetylase domain-containing protein n=1 Tax=Aquatica leii TaxID=1421715 RepID=A0AAN7SMY0_9COLE|nr:hypothetical protein RN001_015999 [Aquatica leii]
MEKTELTRIFEELSLDQNNLEDSNGATVLEKPSQRKKDKFLKKSGPPSKSKIVRPTRRRHHLKFAGLKKQENDMAFLCNEYEKAESCATMLRKETALFYDDETCLHDCLWDVNYIESSKRYLAIMERCQQLDLLDRCVKLPYQLATKEDILKIHTNELYEKLESISANKNIDEVEKIASDYDAVYFNEYTFKASLIAAGNAISLVESVCIGEVQNGMAIIRPPGHHAMSNEYCGFCFFNNVAIAAQYALDNNLAEKILIVDVDVHHGQASQRSFYNTKNVLYFSIHRYEHGAFWPNLRESNFDYIGEGNGLGYNINFPLNDIGRNDSDYLSIIFNILLPVAYEYNPDLIIVSAGYDACIGCPEGEMQVTPAFYGHLITLLSGLANGKIAVCLEGGYFLPSLAEGVAMTIKALLGDACAILPPISKPHVSIIDTINDLRIVLHKYWKCFQIFDIFGSTANPNNYHKVDVIFKGEELKPPYPTRDFYPVNPIEYIEKYTDMVNDLQLEYEAVGESQLVSCCYDEKMLLHQSEGDYHVEQPSRLLEIYKTYKEWNLASRCFNIIPQPFDFDVLKLVHDEAYVKQLWDKQFGILLDKGRDMYFNENTLEAIIKANESLLAVVDSVLDESCRSGAAIIRPPGHHAETNSASGFCFVNNVAVAAKYILHKYPVKRVLILDFDIHHGNGTQNIFYEDNQVMYLSIHKYFPRSFFPSSTDAHSTKCGEGIGVGYNVNIPLTGMQLYNMDYLTIFFNVVLPVLYSFAPEIILVSAGFDAGINDPLGHYCLTPECFGHFIQLIKPLANGRLILALEGGYNLVTVKYSMNICIKTLLGDPLPTINDKNTISEYTVKALKAVKRSHTQYWPALDVDRKLLACGYKTIIKSTSSDSDDCNCKP